MNAAIYCRVSKEDLNLANQLPDIEKLCAARGWTISHRYEEKISGAAKDRPALKQLLEDAHRGEFQVLVVWSLDRLSRRGIAEVAGIVAKLDAMGVALVSVREPWADSSGPVRDLLIAILSWVAGFERKRLIERTKAGLQRAKAEGIILGRPAVRPDLIQTALLKISQGQSIRAVAKKSGIAATTLRKYRNRPTAA